MEHSKGRKGGERLAGEIKRSQWKGGRVGRGNKEEWRGRERVGRRNRGTEGGRVGHSKANMALHLLPLWGG